MTSIREPIKKSSIATKEKIIEKGFELICKKGYHHVNCIDIAKYSGVATGSIYQYFNNKKDILISGMSRYLNKIMFPLIDIDEENITITEFIDKLIITSIKNHKKYKTQHEELLSLLHEDKELSKIYLDSEWLITKDLFKYLKEMDIEISLEKTHIILSLIDNLSHEVIYHNHKELAEAKLIEEVKIIIANMLNK